MQLTSHDLEDLYHRYRFELTRRLYRMVRCDQVAADLAQETYVRLVHLARTSAIPYPRALLHRTATNLAIDHLRKRKVRSLHEVGEVPSEDIPSPMPSAEVELIARQQFERLRQAVATLPPKCRRVFLLHKAKHLPYAHIAARLSISVSTVEKHMCKALAHCRDFMAKGDHSSRLSK
jgi:RNA polymerase sigma-70 factor (ECF subfamily)